MLEVQKGELHSKHRQDKFPIPPLLPDGGQSFEVIKYVRDLFGDIPNFLNTTDLPDLIRRTLTDICGQPQQQARLKIELVRAYQQLRTVESSIANGYYPDIIAVSRLISQGNLPVQTAVD